MRLKIGIVLLFAFLQAALPMPGKAIQDGASKNDSSHSKSAPEQTPRDQTGTNNNPVNTNTDQQNSRPKTGENEKTPIFVRVLPDLSVHKDRADYIYIGGSLLLTLVTLIIAAIALIQANTAKSSVAALINSERAWVDGEIVRKTVVGVNRYELQITNHGKTPAEIFTWSMKSGYLTEGAEFSPEHLSKARVQNLHVFLGSNKSHALYEFKLTEVLGEPSAETSGAICVTIGYADVVSDPKSVNRLRETYFAYYCRPHLQSVERISRENRYT